MYIIVNKYIFVDTKRLVYNYLSLVLQEMWNKGQVHLPKDADGDGGWFLLIVLAPFGPEVQISQGFGGKGNLLQGNKKCLWLKNWGKQGNKETRRKIKNF